MSLSPAASKKPLIAVWKGVNPGFVNFLKEEGAKVYTASNLRLKKNTGILVLNEDLSSGEDLARVEDFVRNGGMLWFASPYGIRYIRKDPAANSGDMNLDINKLLVKAGVYNPNYLIVSTANNNVLITDSVPDYLHIKTALPRLAGNNETAFDRYVDHYLLQPMLNLVFEHNEIGAPIFRKINEYYQVPDSLPSPSVKNPLRFSGGKQRTGIKMAYYLEEKRQNSAVDPGAKAKGYENFPGNVPASAVRSKEKIRVSVKVGTQGLSDPPSVYHRSHSTGLYVPAGETVKIILGKEEAKLGMIAQIGVHQDNVTHLDRITRIPLDLVKRFNLDKETTSVYSPYGGLLMLNIPDTIKVSAVSATVDGAVKAPYFKLGETTEEEWNKTIRDYPAPWAELATGNIVLTVPSYRIRKLNDPVKLMTFWDEVMDADADLAVISRKRVHQERIIVDSDVAYGYMFTIWDRVVVPDDQSCEWMLNADFIRKNGSWGAFHELGHRHQFWGIDFPEVSEVTVNLYTMYVFDKVLKRGIFNHDNLRDKSTMTEKIRAYLRDSPSYDKWSADPFLALSMYAQLIDHFGWDAILEVHRAYRALPKEQYPGTDQDKRDLWFTQICKATQSNLTEFFDTWKVPVSEAAKKQVLLYKPWFPAELRNLSTWTPALK